MEKVKELQNLVVGLSEDAAKFYEKGNKSAGVRVRKTLQLVKALAQEIRKDVVAEQKKD